MKNIYIYIKRTFNSIGSIITAFLLFITITMLVLNLCLNSFFISKNFSKAAEQDILSRADQSKSFFQGKAKEIGVLAQDYCSWDEAYNELQKKEIDKGWFKSNFTDWIPEKYNLDLVVIFNRNKEIVADYGVDGVNAPYILGDKKVRELFDEKSYKQSKAFHGFKELKGEIYIIGVSPILKTNSEGDPQGVAILGKKISSAYLNEIRKQFGEDIFITCKNGFVSDDRIKNKIMRNLSFINENSEKDVILLRNESIIGKTPIVDIMGKSIGNINIVKSRDIFLSTQELIEKNTFRVSCFACVMIFLVGLKFKNVIVKPIKSLEKQITNMKQENSLENVEINGPNEILSLADSFNHMIDNINKHKKENRELRIHSNSDHLTALYNHKYFFECFNNKIEEGCKKIAILFCDIDKFKEINDTYGHTVGDLFLKETAKIIKDEVRGQGLVFRYGGEEFVVMVCEAASEEAYEIAERVRNSVINNKILQKYSQYLPVTISIGIAAYPLDGLDAEGVIDKADSAMYFSKKNGRNQCNVYEKDMNVFLKENINKLTNKEMLLDSVLALAEAIDIKDNYTGRHSKMVSEYSLLLAEGLGFTEKEKDNLTMGALLHDCGKIGVPDNIIQKTSRLSEDEIVIIRNHTLLGYNIIKHIIKDEEIICCARSHHERWDGKGYPDGLTGESINLFARIVCIADAYHAMTSDRSYRKAMTKEEALQEIKRGKGTQFDPELVEVFIKAVRNKLLNSA